MPEFAEHLDKSSVGSKDAPMCTQCKTNKHVGRYDFKGSLLAGRRKASEWACTVHGGNWIR
jgi:hypothetical protein